MNSGIPKPWNLVADIGGTNARFARKTEGDNRLYDITGISVDGHENFPQALVEFLTRKAEDAAWLPHPEAACFAVACRPDHEQIRLTNSPWHFSRTQVQGMLGGAPLDIVNDFAAKGYGISELGENDWVQVGNGEPVPGKPVAIIGPGTGLGVSLAVPTGEGWVVVDGEGGHVDFAPVDALEFRLLEILARQFGRVSVERLLSGAGLLNIYRGLAEMRGLPATLATPEAVSSAGKRDEDPLAKESLRLFCRVLGATAGNLALTAGALGGVYITGGIIPGMLEFLLASEFRARFDAKGRFRGYLGRIPVRVVIRQDLGLLGAAKRLTLAGR